MMNFHVALYNEFNLRQEHRDKLLSYYILHWKTEYLLRKLEDDGTLIHNEITYTPIYLDHLVRLEEQVKLSFRHVHSMHDTPNIVLIRTK